ncbi:MAG: N-methyl-L-tryptophan oxidase [Dehalococcoidia bacterium]
MVIKNLDKKFDTIVIGLGAMGSSTLYQLAKKKKKVLGIEQSDIPNLYGSSHGINRIIRLAYSEHPSYVPMLMRAYELWYDLEEQCKEKILYKTGSLDISSENHWVFSGSLESCIQHNIEHQVLSSNEISSKFPAYNFPVNYKGLYQKDGGFLLSERAIINFVNLAIENNADVTAHEKVLNWEVNNGEVLVETNKSRYKSDSLVISAGSWMNKLIPELINLAVPERQVLGWFKTKNDKLFRDNFPVFSCAVDEGRYYGSPIHDIPGFKIGKYNHLKQLADPDQQDTDITKLDEIALRSAIKKYFPLANGNVINFKTCMFTNTPDEHFIIDKHPKFSQVFIAGGFSGHGFKFTTVIGEIISQMIIKSNFSKDLEFLRLSRFN